MMEARNTARRALSMNADAARDISETTLASRLAVAPQSTLARNVDHTRHCGHLSARSSAMHELFDFIDRFAPTDVTVTLLGETGVGKDVAARTLHQLSARSKEPFVVFDCGAVASNLAESELLGHERGSFTGAIAGYSGAFERAHGGTLFLDEIAELPLDLQPRLLRALESRCIRRVGGKHDRSVNVRVIAATNRDLRGRVAAGAFREDLFFRLAVAVVALPPLRERQGDLPTLVAKMLAELGHENMRVHEATYEILQAHSWPGNVRELKNALACAAAFVDPGCSVLFPWHFRLLAGAKDRRVAIDQLPLGGETLDRIERAAIRQTMMQAAGNKSNAARTLGIAVSTLHEKLKQHGLY